MRPFSSFRIPVVAGLLSLLACNTDSPVTPLNDGMAFARKNPDVNFALAFDGNDFVEVPDAASLDVSNTFTIEAWIKPGNVNGSLQHVVSKWGLCWDASYTLVVNAGKLRSGIASCANGTQAVESNGTLVDGVWQHVAITLGAGTLRLYIDGVLDKEYLNSQAPIATTTVLSIGKESNYVRHFQGLIDDVRIWNVARTEDEIAGARYELKGKKTGLVGWWRFDEGSGDVAKDATKNKNHGRLGSPDEDPEWVSVTREPLSFAAVYAGGGTGSGGGADFTCALTAEGVAYCWGENTFGQLGTSGGNRGVPVAVAGAHRFSSLSVGGIHSCGIDDAGDTYCWGYNIYGQVGDGTQVNRFAPVSAVASLNLAQVAAGGFTSCGIDGTDAAHCWGWGGLGERGEGVRTEVQTTPVAVSGGLTFGSIAIGAYHTCGLLVDGTAYCWGNNLDQQVGHVDGNSLYTVPVPVNTALSFTSIHPSGLWSDAGHTCALTATGAAYCWGDNQYGQVGDGTDVGKGSPTAVSGGLTFVALASRGEFACGLTSRGKAYCWGRNDFGQLGNGTEMDSSVPVPVSGKGRWESLSAGSYHACGVTRQGDAYCWGRNLEGALGDGTFTNSSSPVKVVVP